MTLTTPGVEWSQQPDKSWRPTVVGAGGTPVSGSPRFAVGDLLLTLPNFENFPYGHMGELEVTAGTQVLYLDGAYTMVSARAYVNTAPVGADAVIELMKNGSSVVTLTIADGTHTDLDTTGVTFVAGDKIRFDITQVGSTTPGADLTVLLRMVETG